MFNDVDDKDGDDNVSSCNLCSRWPDTRVWGGCWEVPAKNRGVPTGCDDDDDCDGEKKDFKPKNTILALLKL